MATKTVTKTSKTSKASSDSAKVSEKDIKKIVKKETEKTEKKVKKDSEKHVEKVHVEALKIQKTDKAEKTETEKPKKGRKSDWERADMIYSEIIKSGLITEDEFKKKYAKMVSSKSNFSNKKSDADKKPLNNYLQFCAEYRAEHGKTKQSDLKVAWAAAKADPDSKWHCVEIPKVKPDYSGLKPGDAVPGKDNYIMGLNGRPVLNNGPNREKINAGKEETKKESEVETEDEEEAEEEEENSEESSEESDEEED
jgi:hypothetical protein